MTSLVISTCMADVPLLESGILSPMYSSGAPRRAMPAPERSSASMPSQLSGREAEGWVGMRV